jgi:hypothetical protein
MRGPVFTSAWPANACILLLHRRRGLQRRVRLQGGPAWSPVLHSHPLSHADNAAVSAGRAAVCCRVSWPQSQQHHLQEDAPRWVLLAPSSALALHSTRPASGCHSHHADSDKTAATIRHCSIIHHSLHHDCCRTERYESRMVEW